MAARVRSPSQAESWACCPPSAEESLSLLWHCCPLFVALGDLWLLCHFHTTGLIAPNGDRFFEGKDEIGISCRPPGAKH